MNVGVRCCQYEGIPAAERPANDAAAVAFALGDEPYVSLLGLRRLRIKECHAVRETHDYRHRIVHSQ